jgi:hypothetical protein
MSLRNVLFGERTQSWELEPSLVGTGRESRNESSEIIAAGGNLWMHSINVGKSKCCILTWGWFRSRSRIGHVVHSSSEFNEL